MDKEGIIAGVRALDRSPAPEEKEAFLKHLDEEGLTGGRAAVMSHGEFLSRQFRYIRKWTWLLSGALLLLIMGLCYREPGNRPFALTSLLAAGILGETGRSRQWRMAELERAARFSLISVLLARAFLTGIVDTAGLLLVMLMIRPLLPYAPIRIFFYMMVPYLAASLLGSVYERKQRPEHGWGSVLICLLSSVFFAVAPLFINRLYEDELTIIWAAAFVLLGCGLAVSTRRWAGEMEECGWCS
ncbi:MAG: hypothetical protein IJH38_03930 [Clostridia bacterium]|nr:hypothetical protein [Clostridia bacterium]